MDRLLQPTVLFALTVIAVPVGITVVYSFRKIRERQMQHHQDMCIREMEHQAKMKQLEIELEKAKQKNTSAVSV